MSHGPIAAVHDDQYLRSFAEDARNSGIPVSLRFASEMNGDWTAAAYGANPELFKAKFRMVAEVMHETAPDVAMVWCPNEVPQGPIPKYFPGDDAVDWGLYEESTQTKILHFDFEGQILAEAHGKPLA